MASSALLQTLVCAQQRRALARMLAYPKSSWDDLAPGLARRETVSSVEEVEKSRRRAGPWRQTKGTTKPLGGRRPRPPESITTGPSVQAPECPRWPTLRALFPSPPRCLVAPSKTAECDRVKAHRQVGASILFLCWLGFVNRPHWQSLGTAKDQGHDAVCHSYRGNARPEACRALGSLCLPTATERKKKVG